MKNIINKEEDLIDVLEAMLYNDFQPISISKFHLSINNVVIQSNYDLPRYTEARNNIKKINNNSIEELSLFIIKNDKIPYNINLQSFSNNITKESFRINFHEEYVLIDDKIGYSTKSVKFLQDKIKLCKNLILEIEQITSILNDVENEKNEVINILIKNLNKGRL